MKKKLTFKAIGVVAAINLDGDIVGLVVRDDYIDRDCFNELQRQIKTKYSRKKVFLFLVLVLGLFLCVVFLLSLPLCFYLKSSNQFYHSHSERISEFH